MKHLLSALALTLIFTSSAFALTDPDYKELMKDSKFAAAEKELAEAWNEAKSKMPAEHFKHLQAEQREWLSKGRDKGAADLMKADPKMSRAEAYAQETGSRVEAINSAVNASSLTPENAEGFFVLNENGRYIELTVSTEGNSLSAQFMDNKGSQLWNAEGKISANVLTVSDEKGSAQITYWNLSRPEVKSDKKLKDNSINIDGRYSEPVTAF